MRRQSTLMQLAGGFIAAVLGTFPILAGLGLLRGGDDIEPVGRVLAVGFGGVFVAIGLVLLGQPFVAMAKAQGARTGGQVAALGVRRLLGRADSRSALAAVGVGVLALGCWGLWLGAPIPLLGDRDALQAIVRIEFLLIHGFPFLVIAATFVRVPKLGPRVAAPGCVLPLVLLYSAFAWKVGGGWWGILALLYLLAPNLLAFAHAGSSVASRVLAVSRWALKFACFMLLAAIMTSGDLERADVTGLGAVYFTVLGLLELFRVTEIPLELAMPGATATPIANR